MHGTLPLIVDVRMAALAGGGIHEVVFGHRFTGGGLRGTGKEMPTGAIAFAVHTGGSDRRILDAVRALPWNRSNPPRACGKKYGHHDKSTGAQKARAEAAGKESALARPRRREKGATR